MGEGGLAETYSIYITELHTDFLLEGGENLHSKHAENFTHDFLKYAFHAEIIFQQFTTMIS